MSLMLRKENWHKSSTIGIKHPQQHHQNAKPSIIIFFPKFDFFCFLLATAAVDFLTLTFFLLYLMENNPIWKSWNCQRFPIHTYILFYIIMGFYTRCFMYIIMYVVYTMNSHTTIFFVYMAHIKKIQSAFWFSFFCTNIHKSKKINLKMFQKRGTMNFRVFFPGFLWWGWSFAECLVHEWCLDVV